MPTSPAGGLAGASGSGLASVGVHVDIDSQSDALVRLAAGVADRFGARLIGFAACAPRPPYAESILAAESGAKDRERVHAELKAREQRFRELTRALKPPGEWRCAIDMPDDAVAREARAVDVVVIGKERGSHDPYRSLDPGSMLLRAGRPVLVVPRGLNTFLGKRVLIAWQDTREARRALRDALPFLHQAEEVLVTEIRDDDDRANSHVADVAKYLSHHGIHANPGVRLKSSSGTVAEEMLRLAEAEMTDLIVAGAYGHSRLGEWMFGGVTRDLLKTSPVCCLFSH